METVQLTPSENVVMKKLKKFVLPNDKPYYFWFKYDSKGIAIDWAGGFGLSSDIKYRNQFTMQKNKPLVKNWD